MSIPFKMGRMYLLCMGVEVMRCVGFSGMLLSFATTLQDVLVFWDAMIFCNNFVR
jgi:hypothetical protein